VLVVIEKPCELLLRHFWLITNWSAEEKSGEALLDLYRERGTAEGHQGELKDVLAPALSSTNRSKTHYRGRELAAPLTQINAFEVNEVRLLLNALAYNLMHAARVVLEQITSEGWSLRRMRERVLRIASRVVLHARYVTVVVGDAGCALWQALLPRLQALGSAVG
jgi:hypothetical protein